MTAQVALIIVGCVFSVLLTFAIFYMKEIRTGLQRYNDIQDRRIERLEQKAEQMPEKYVLREDFIRWSIVIDKKIDDMRVDIQTILKECGWLQKTEKSEDGS